MTESGQEMLSLRQISYLVAEIETAIGDELERNYQVRRAEAERANERAESDRCHQMWHPNEFGRSSDICTPCLRRYYAIQSRRRQGAQNKCVN